MSTGAADNLLHAIANVHRRWLEGALSQEDALFEIGDRLEGVSLCEDSLAVASSGGAGEGRLAKIGDASV